MAVTRTVQGGSATDAVSDGDDSRTTSQGCFGIANMESHNLTIRHQVVLESGWLNVGEIISCMGTGFDDENLQRRIGFG